jgi:hypothetical protein
MGRDSLGAADVFNCTSNGSTLGGFEERASKADQGMGWQRQLVWPQL